MNFGNAALFSFLFCSANLQAGLALPHIVSDNMMLQRDQPARIWGQVDDGTRVTVHFKDQTKSSTVKDDPMVNLFGKNGLPVGPFRTDTFQLTEKNP